jgi:hypothetical protein
MSGWQKKGWSFSEPDGPLCEHDAVAVFGSAPADQGCPGKCFESASPRVALAEDLAEVLLEAGDGLLTGVSCVDIVDGMGIAPVVSWLAVADVAETVAVAVAADIDSIVVVTFAIDNSHSGLTTPDADAAVVCATDRNIAWSTHTSGSCRCVYAVVVRWRWCLVGWPTSPVRELDSSESVNFGQFRQTVLTHYSSAVRARVR